MFLLIIVLNSIFVLSDNQLLICGWDKDLKIYETNLTYINSSDKVLSDLGSCYYDNDYYYLGGGNLYVMHKNNLTQYKEITISGNIINLFIENNYLYIGASSFQRYYLNNLTLKDSYNYGNIVNDFDIDDDFIYLVGGKSLIADSNIVKLNKTNLNYINESLPYGTNQIEKILIDNDYIYIAGIGGTIQKYYKNNLSHISTSPSYGSIYIYGMDFDEENIYIVGSGVSGRVKKYSKDTLSYIAQSGTYSSTASFELKYFNNSVYVGYMNGVVRQLNTSSFSLLNSVSYGNRIFDIIIEPKTIIINDVTPPIINITTPINNTEYFIRNQSINFSVTDNVAIDSVILNINGVNQTINSSVNDTSYNYTSTYNFNEGTNYIIVYVNDTSSNNATLKHEFNITLLAPNLTINNPINNQKYNNKTQFINISVSDDYHLITDVKYQINNVNHTDLNLTNFTFIEGTNTLKVYVTNDEDKTTTEQISFVIDTTPPNLIITSPKNNYKYQDTLIDIIISATDTNNVDKIWYIINNVTYNYTLPTDYDFGIGNQTMYIYANDTLNNTIEKIIEFKTGYIPPVIDKVIIGQCPTNKQAMLNLWIIIIICIALGLIGIIIKQIILPIITGFGLIVLSLSLYNCGDILSFVVVIIGLMYLLLAMSLKK